MEKDIMIPASVAAESIFQCLDTQVMDAPGEGKLARKV